MRTFPLTMIVGLMVALPSSFLSAEEAGETPLVEQVRQAYASAEYYQATVTFRVDSQQGRWTMTRHAEIYVAFDRAGGRLMIDKPEFRVVVEGGQLRMNTDQLPGAHLELAMGDPLTWSGVTQAVPPIAEPPQVDAIFLLADDPIATLTGGRGKVEAGDEPWQLRMNSAKGPLTLFINPQTHLIDRATIEMARGSSVVTYTFDVTGIDVPPGDERFAFDTSGSDPADSIQGMVAVVRARQQQGGGLRGGPSAGGHPLQGRDAPEIELATSTGDPFKLSEVEADVVVLDFWATWCGPCREGLPQIQAVADWAAKENKSVAVYAVNVGETAKEANRFWAEQGFTMSVVMDEQKQAAGAYAVQGIPQTVVIANGKVIAVHVGLVPNLEQTLKAQINAALEKE